MLENMLENIGYVNQEVETTDWPFVVFRAETSREQGQSNSHSAYSQL